MLLYTIIPMEVIFSNTGNSQFQYEEYSLDGGFVQVAKSESGYRVKRLISTDPQMYLNPMYQPGSIIEQSNLKNKFL